MKTPDCSIFWYCKSFARITQAILLHVLPEIPDTGSPRHSCFLQTSQCRMAYDWRWCRKGSRWWKTLTCLLEMANYISALCIQWVINHFLQPIKCRCLALAFDRISHTIPIKRMQLHRVYVTECYFALCKYNWIWVKENKKDYTVTIYQQ